MKSLIKKFIYNILLGAALYTITFADPDPLIWVVSRRWNKQAICPDPYGMCLHKNKAQNK